VTKHANWVNAGTVACALGLSLGLGALGRDPGRPPAEYRRAAPRSGTVTDATGQALPARPFRRIASASTVADRLLIELCEPDRVVAFSAYGVGHSPWAHQYAGRSQITSLADLEGILALKPDLLLVNNYGSPAAVTRLREAGVAVFDLGEMRGLATLLANMRSVAALLGHPERGERFVTAFRRRFERVAAGLDPARRRRGLYLSIYGTKLFGATTGTSHHDVLVHAGLIDAAAKVYDHWPQYTPEQVLALDPEVIVTKPGMALLVCRSAGLDRLRVCKHGAIVEVPGEILDDPGPPILDAAEWLFAAVYGGAG
jgi:iron complex transport system substrate-binding protein